MEKAMGFQIIDPSAGRIGATKGRSALKNIIRFRPTGEGKKALRFTISEDLLAPHNISRGDKINLMIGYDEDYGSIFIAKTTKTDPMGYSVFSVGVKSRALSFTIHASKVYGISVSSPVDCLVKQSERGITATIPLSALGFERNGATVKTVPVVNGSAV
jgi:hypothetical protein